MEEIEIERKWLLKACPGLDYDQVIQIEQYYKDWLRYRRQHDGIGEFFFCIKKERLSHGVNRETKNGHPWVTVKSVEAYPDQRRNLPRKASP